MPEPRRRLPRRDLVLIPLLSVLTVVALMVMAEAAARMFWTESEVDACVIPDAALGHRFKPNCVSRVKSMEGPWVTNRYNACGYRTDQACGHREEGVRRVDLMGSSTAQGYLVPLEHTIGASMASALSMQCRAEVQVENMGGVGYDGEVIIRQLDEALALKPDAVVLVVTPFDFDLPPASPLAQAKAPEAPPQKHLELLRVVHNLVSDSWAGQVAQHLMFIDSNRFASLYLSYGDRADFIRPPFSTAWQQRLAYFGDVVGRMQARLGPAGVRLVVAYVPSRVQAIYLSETQRPNGVDPFAFGKAVGGVASSRGVGYVDLSTAFAGIPDAGAMFYPQNGHMTEQGQPLVGHAVATELLADAAPFRSCARSDSASLLPAGSLLSQASR